MKTNRFISFYALALILISMSDESYAAEEEMEELVVQARLLSGAEALINDRLNDDSVTDLLSAEMISRIGDSTVAAALKRISGISLVGGKYIYVRGLGERYSTSSLNGATIPSPDLTRNVIPLDIFPTSIVSSLAVQKSYSPDRPASFGGGAVDIRTKGIPDGFTYSIEFGGGYNTELDSALLSYKGGGDDKYGKDDGVRALSKDITSSIARFSGRLNSQNILNTLRKEGNVDATLADAQSINRDLALSLNRDISIEKKGSDPDWGLRASVGNNFLLDEDWEFGFLVGGSYATRWRKTETTARNFSFPEERFEKESETTRTVDLYGTINFGIRFTDDHEISTTTLFIRNTDDEVAVIDFFNENREKSDGIGFRDERIKFEEREMIVNQIKGTHYLGEATRELVPWMPLDWIPETFQVDWYYSNATAKTDIPNEVNVSSETVSDSITGIVSASNVMTDSAAADYRFTNLEDEVINYAGHFTWPISTVTSYIEISGGGEHSQKVRTYEQSQFSLGALRVNNADVLRGPLGSVFSDSNIIDTANNFVFDLTGTNNQSYIAVTMTDALFGNVDWTWNDTWRVSAGARWEDYKQVALDHNIYAYTLTSPQVSNDPQVLANSVFTSNEFYPSVSLTYMTDWWAETFQLRFGWSQTVVRPDLREITDASYVDARTGFLTRGDPSVVPSDIINLDLRAEWFFNSGDNLTIGVYAKDIKRPIEFFESAASDTNRSREIVNAESGNVYGVEIEGLKALGFLGEFWEAFFVQGNLTLQASELVAGAAADAPTNPVRDLSGASNYVVNFLIGFDSFNTKHAATLSYNVFGERLFAAGRRGAPDAFEQPFNSLDLTYSWYPRDNASVKLKLQNILDESVTIKRRDLLVFDEKPGMGVSLGIKWMM